MKSFFFKISNFYKFSMISKGIIVCFRWQSLNCLNNHLNEAQKLNVRCFSISKFLNLKFEIFFIVFQLHRGSVTILPVHFVSYQTPSLCQQSFQSFF